MKNFRCERVADQIVRAAAQILTNKVSDPRLAEVTITGAKVTQDLKVAFIYYSHRDTAEEIETVKQAIAKASGFLRRELGMALKMRYVPELRFEFDRSLEHGNKIWDQLAALNVDLDEDPLEEVNE